MADIDLVIDVVNGPANAKLAQTAGAVNTVGKAGANSGKVLGVFNSQLNSGAVAAGLSAAGFSSLGASLSALPLLIHPVTLALIGAGGLLFAMKKWIDNAKEIKRIAREVGMAPLAIAGRANLKSTIALTDALASGFSPERARLAGQMARQQELLNERTKDFLGFVEAEEKALKDGLRTREEFNANIRVMREDYLNLTAASRERLRALREEDALMQMRTSQDNASTMLNAQQMGGVAPGMFGGNTKALTDQVQQLTLAKKNLIEQMQLEVTMGRHVTDGQIQQLRTLEIMIFQLERQKSLYEELGAVIQDAMGGLAVGAFDAYADALDETMALNNLFAGGTDRAMRNAAASVLRQVGQIAAIHVAEELALAATTAMNPAAAVLYGPATEHLKAAAMWAGVAAAAGAAAGATSVAMPGSGGSVPGVDTSTDRDRGGGHIFQFTIIGNLDTESREDLLEQLREASEGRDI